MRRIPLLFPKAPVVLVLFFFLNESHPKIVLNGSSQLNSLSGCVLESLSNASSCAYQ